MPQVQKLVEATLCLVKVEKAALENALPSYGSIFFCHDLWPGMSFTVVDDTFAIRPSLSRSFWDDKHEAMDINHRPCEIICMSISSSFFFREHTL